MGLLGNLLVRMNLDSSNVVQGLNSTVAAFSAATGRMTSTVGAGFDNMTQRSNSFHQAASGNFKDISRIAQGILVSQAFYKVTSAIQDSIKAVATFSSGLEQARTSFEILMKDGKKAGDFVNYLQDFAAKTPFTMQQSVENARKLLAYGFDSNSIGTVMTTLADAASASGDSESFNKVGRALGQIHTKGKLAAQELLQITEAGIPAFEILKEKLQLTNDQLGKIGDQGIPADLAIKAILSGMNERYGGAMVAMSNTTGGMLNTIKDNALIIGSTIFEPLFGSAKGVLTRIRNLTDSWRQSLKAGGIGQLIQNMFPPEIVTKIQLIAANVKMFFQSLSMLRTALMPLVKVLIEFGVNTANIVLPVLNVFIRVLSILAVWVTSNERLIRTFVADFGGFIVAAWATRLLLNFGAAVRSLYIIKAIVSLVTSLAKAIKVLSLAMVTNPWIAVLTIAAGVVLYFGLTSKTVSAWIDDLTGSLMRLMGVDPSAIFVPKTEDNTVAANEFTQSLANSSSGLDDLGDSAEKAGKKAKDALMSFDEVFNLKDPTDETEDAWKSINPDSLNTSIPMTPAITMPEMNTSDILSPIQDWVNKFKDLFMGRLKDALIGAGIGALIGAIIGGLIGGPIGAKIGAIIGAFVGGIVGYFFKDLAKQFREHPVRSATAALGYALGILMGPIAGLMGTLVGAIIGDQIEHWIAGTQGPLDKWAAYTKRCFTNWVADTKSRFRNWKNDTMTDFRKWITDSENGFNNWVANTKNSISGWITSTGGKFTNWCITSKNSFIDWWISNGNGFISWKNDVAGNIGNWSSITKEHLSGWWTSTKTGFSQWWIDSGFGFNQWSSDTLVGIQNWCNNSLTSLANWNTNAKQSFYNWFAEIKNGFIQWGVDCHNGVIGYFEKIVSKILEVFQRINNAKNSLFGGGSKLSTAGLTGAATAGAGVGLGESSALSGLSAHAKGGVFNKEHYASFAEGNKAEAIIPLEDNAAMQPFVTAVSNGLTASLSGILSTIGSQPRAAAAAPDTRPIMYVGTLIADDRGLKELNRKLNVIELSEKVRRS